MNIPIAVEGGVVNKEMADSPSFGRHGKKRGFVAKKHGMKTRSAIAAEKKTRDESNIRLSWNLKKEATKSNIRLSWNLKKEATKIIETDVASGYDFNDKVTEYQGEGNDKVCCLAVKGHGMKTMSSKYKMSWILEEEISKIINLGTALGFDFYDKEVRMADIIAKAILKLKGAKLKMANK